MRNNKQRQEVRHMTDMVFRIEMHALDKRDTSLRKQIYKGSIQGALAIMGAWIQDAHTIANDIGEIVGVHVKSESDGDLLTAYSYVDPQEKQ